MRTAQRQKSSFRPFDGIDLLSFLRFISIATAGGLITRPASNHSRFVLSPRNSSARGVQAANVSVSNPETPCQIYKPPISPITDGRRHSPMVLLLIISADAGNLQPSPRRLPGRAAKIMGEGSMGGDVRKILNCNILSHHRIRCNTTEGRMHGAATGGRNLGHGLRCT